ncbi:MAG: GntR family transcriptional regulator [Alphaproteobacteria bacterium]
MATREPLALARGRARQVADAAGADERLADRAYKELERLIVTAELAPGEWATESDLSERLGLSRTPIREALQRLVRARLIEVVPRRGLQITAVRVEDQLALLSFRREVERFLATRSAERATPADRRRLREMAAGMDECARTRDEAGHYVLDLEYKLLLVRAAGNEHAGEAIAPLWASSRRFAWVTRAVRDIVLSSNLSAAVMRAIADGDGPGAARCTDAYMDALEQLARNSLDVLP